VVDPAFERWLTRWGLVVDGPGFSTLFGSKLLPVLKDGEKAMLKIAGHEEERRGAALMAWWDGDGAARVLALEGDALLLERLDGGADLAAMARAGQDEAATAILCDVAGALHAPRGKPPPASLVPLETWFSALWPAAETHGGAFAKAAAAARPLLAAPREIVALHGFEFANLFRNPDAATALAPGRLARQVELVAERAGLERARLLAWILAYAGLGAAWSLQSGHHKAAETGLAIAELAGAELKR
jgi:streptomycin 6-kinase